LLYPYGPLVSLHISYSSHSAFLNYADRASAEYAISQLQFADLVIADKKLVVNWARPRITNTTATNNDNNGGVDETMPAPPGLENAPVSSYALGHLPLPTVQYGNSSSDKTNGNKKRKVAAALDDLGDDDDDDNAGPWASSTSTTATNKPKSTKPNVGNYVHKRPTLYPSQDPARLGAKY
jgi:hypothetical protein